MQCVFTVHYVALDSSKIRENLMQ